MDKKKILVFTSISTIFTLLFFYPNSYIQNAENIELGLSRQQVKEIMGEPSRMLPMSGSPEGGLYFWYEKKYRLTMKFPFYEWSYSSKGVSMVFKEDKLIEKTNEP